MIGDRSRTLDLCRVPVATGEPIDRALKTLEKQVRKADLLGELKRRTAYESRGARRRRKRAAATWRRLRAARKAAG